jgi:beta-lactamase superfamily II metal-dependent hydrolase
MKLKRIKSLLGFVSIFFLVVTGTAWAANLEVHIINVGQGDCELIISPTGKTVLVDAGRNGKGNSTIIPYLNNLGITDLDYIVASHYHADHIGGIDEVITGLGGISHILSAVYDRGGTYKANTITYQDYCSATQEKRITIVPGDVIDIGGGAILTCIAAHGCTETQTVITGDDENNLGVVLRLDYRDFQMCLGGDIEGDVEGDMETVIASLVGDVDVYKVHHHGSDTSSNQEFLDIILPEVSTIPVGNDNSYGHPASITHNNLVDIGSYIYQTETGNVAPPPGYGEVTNGSFKIETDGCSYTVSGPTVSPTTYSTDCSCSSCCCSDNILFSEVLYDSQVSGDTAGEWIELYNPSLAAVDIGGWTISDNYDTFAVPSGTSIAAGGYLVIADDATEFYAQYGCRPDVSGLTLRLSNDGDYLTLKDGDGNVKDQAAWESGGAQVAGWGSSSLPKADEGFSIARADLNRDTDTYADWSSNQMPCPGNCGIPIISLNRTQLNYGSGGGATTAAQTFLIGNTGCGTLNWTVTHDAAWLNCSPDSGSGPAQVAVSVDTAGLTVGTYTGTISVTGAQASNSPQTISVTLNVYGYDSAPFGEFAGPIHGSTVSSSVPVTGWALDDVGIDNVKIYRDPVNGESGGLVYIGDAVLVEGARPDIETAYPQYPMSYKAGWGYMMLTNFLPNGGNGTFVLYAVATDVSGHQVTLGSATITCDNANAVKPFGAIDTPLPGGEASGGTYKNNGWVLTPMPNKIPEDGSTIAVYIDGVFLGRPTYNIYRSDIEMLFPGYADSDGAGASFTVDTTAYSDGLHTIAWVAEDDAGNADGIGSRYFTVQNSAQRSLVNGHWSFGKNNLSRLAVDDSTPVRVKRGYDPNTKPIEFYPTPAARGANRGIITIEIKELERIEIRLFPDVAAGLATLYSLHSTCYQIVGDQLKPLPIGSTLDAKRGVFYWQPGPGFTGQYEFIFLSGESLRIKKKNITITIVTDRELP